MIDSSLGKLTMYDICSKNSLLCVIVAFPGHTHFLFRCYEETLK